MTRCRTGMVRHPAFDAPHVGEPLNVVFDVGVSSKEIALEQLLAFFECFDQPSRRIPALATR